MLTSWSQLNLQDSFSSVAEEFVYFHDFTNMILLFILTFVGVVLGMTVTNKIIHKGLSQGQMLEAIWTLAPALVLTQVALPSLVLLYTLEEYSTGLGVTVKVTGHQWYWSYEYPQFINFQESSFDSYMVQSPDLKNGEFRLLEVDNRLCLPAMTPLRLLVTSSDVLHAWTIPSLGLKVDAIPGRLNQLSTEINAVGVFYGQCSEICGANHSFMPINVESILLKSWISSNLYN